MSMPGCAACGSSAEIAELGRILADALEVLDDPAAAAPLRV